MSTKSMFAKLAVLLVAVVGAQSALAQNGKKQQTTSSTFPMPAPAERNRALAVHMGVSAGVASPEGSYNSAGNYGLNVGFQPYIPFGVGAEVAFSKNTGVQQVDIERTVVLARGTYNFGGTIPVLKNSFVGMGVGPVFKPDGTEAAIAPLVGFDIPLSEQDHNYLSLGADAKYLVVNGSDADMLAVNGVLKYWY